MLPSNKASGKNNKQMSIATCNKLPYYRVHRCTLPSGKLERLEILRCHQRGYHFRHSLHCDNIETLILISQKSNPDNST